MLYKILLAVLLIAGTNAYSQIIPGPPAKRADIRYGKDGLIKYDLQTGLLTVYQGDSVIFKDVYSTARVNGNMVSSTEYKEGKYIHIPLNDSFGKGTLHMIVLSGNKLPVMKQCFYTYPGRSYFMVETLIEGKEIKSNYIVPFSGKFTVIHGDARTLFMPFDNDAFISYQSVPFTPATNNISSEAGVVYDSISRTGFVIGSVEHETWKTGVGTIATREDSSRVEVTAGYVSESLTRDKMQHGTLKGNRIRSPRIFIGYYSDWRTGLEDYGKANRLCEPPYVFNWTSPVPVGWNSWGVIQDKLSMEKISKVTSFMKDSLPAFRTGNTLYVDLDSYWDNLLRRDQPDAFIQLKQVVADCMAKGLQPGIYWGPFVDWGSKTDGHRKAEGSNYTFGEMWTKTGNGYHDFDGARALDPTHPGTRQRIAWMMGKFKECGFKMIKIDFLGHAAAESDKFYNTQITTGMQAFRSGMEYLVDQAGSQMLIYAAISPNLATGRYAHTRRIACDAFKSISDTRYTLNSLTYGWWQTGLYNFIDADHVVLGSEQPGTNRARFLSAVITGTVITGDDFSSAGPWSAVARKLYQDPEFLKVIIQGKAFKPVEGSTGKGASEMFIRNDKDYMYLAVFNYDDAPKAFNTKYSRLGLPDNGTYEIQELMQHQQIPSGSTFSVTINGSDALLFKIKTISHIQ